MTDDVITTLNHASTLIEEENGGLKEGNVALVTGLLRRKEAVIAALKTLPPLVCQRPDAEKSSEQSCCSPELQKASQRLDLALTENRELLTRALVAQKHIIKLLAQAMSPPEQKTRYGRDGSYSAHRKTTGAAYRKNA